jgi:hypothetical protein
MGFRSQFSPPSKGDSEYANSEQPPAEAATPPTYRLPDSPPLGAQPATGPDAQIDAGKAENELVPTEMAKAAKATTGSKEAFDAGGGGKKMQMQGNSNTRKRMHVN